MTAAQLCGGKISAAFASTRRRWSMANKTSGSNSMCRSFGSCSSLAAIRKRCEDVSGR
ncbi:hypothetical protein BVRB_9g212800 [Beta vulgaris subsp. vulgaris]|nr:hypothetical protein BVRB_9g212800 [Beta vulgaris subsp. vulgaris]